MSALVFRRENQANLPGPACRGIQVNVLRAHQARLCPQQMSDRTGIASYMPSQSLCAPMYFLLTETVSAGASEALRPDTQSLPRSASKAATAVEKETFAILPCFPICGTVDSQNRIAATPLLVDGVLGVGRCPGFVSTSPPPGVAFEFTYIVAPMANHTGGELQRRIQR